ncbi:hypothetical protein DYH09_08585 [bacterium CPR1]|nr:hypothetical protein [bacterium CPR1]
MESDSDVSRESARQRPAISFGDSRTPGMACALSTLALETAFEDRKMQAQHRTAPGPIHSISEMAFQLADTDPQDFHILVNGW